MATNNITSGKSPKRYNSRRLVDTGVSQFPGDPIREQMAGKRHRLAEVSGQSMAGLTVQQRDVLLRQAGLPVRRGKTTL